MQIDKAKLIAWLDKQYFTASPLEKARGIQKVLNEVKSGTFDLIPTDVDVKEIVRKLKCNETAGLDDEPYYLDDEVRLLLSKYTETLAQVEEWRERADRWHDAELLAQTKLDQAVEALERIIQTPQGVWQATTGEGHAECLVIARSALQSIKGVDPHAST